MKQPFDLLVIGSGVAGRATASICRKAGWKVAIAEQREIGGTCPLRGCDPKKILLGAAELLDATKRMNGKGITSTDLAIDWPSLMRFKRTFTEPMPAHLTANLEHQKISILHGKATFLNNRQVLVAGETWEARHFLIATGAEPAPLPIEGASNLITSDEFLDLPNLPQRIVCVGGGFISMELSHLGVRCGRDVTVLEYLDRPLQPFDPDLVDRIVRKSREIGIRLKTGAQVKRITKNGHEFLVEALVSGTKMLFPADIVVHGAGRVPATRELNLDAAQIVTEHGGIKVNEYLQSVSNPGVYAAGDVAATPSPQLTRVAAYQGKLVAKNLLDGNKYPADHNGIPSVVFTIPSIATVGLSEQTARDSSVSVNVRYEDMGDWFTTRKSAEATAAYKLITSNSSGQILGAHVLAHQSGEIINLFAMAIRLGLSVNDLKKVILAYPTEGAVSRYML